MTDEMTNHPGSEPAPAPALDVPGLIRRVRRTCDLSQLDLAGRLGVSQSAIARWETGEAEPALALFGQLVALAGWTLSVHDDNAARVRPMRPDGVRDAAGRRRPAHLDVLPERPTYYCWGRTITDRRARGRTWRDSTRRHRGVVPDDHPTQHEIDQFLAAWRQHREDESHRIGERMQAARMARDPSPEEPCHCLDGCFEVPGCLTTCACTCEGALFEPGGTEPVGWVDNQTELSSLLS